MPGKGCWGQWLCHLGVLWPLEDEWSISLWEIWCFATGQTKRCPQVNSFTSGKHSQCCCSLRAWHSPKTQGFCHHWGDCRRSQAGALILMSPSHDISLKYLQCIWGNCAPSDMKQTAKQLPHHSASSRSWVQLFKPIFPFPQCICQEPTLEQKIRANGGWGEQKLTQTFDLNLT